MSSSHDPVIRMIHCLIIVLKIPLFSMSSSHDPVIRMLHCPFIVLKIPLFSMSSSHDPVIRMFHCLFIVLKISLFSMSSSHDPVIRVFHHLFIIFKIQHHRYSYSKMVSFFHRYQHRQLPEGEFSSSIIACKFFVGGKYFHWLGACIKFMGEKHIINDQQAYMMSCTKLL